MEEQFGDERIVPFSFSTNPDEIQKKIKEQIKTNPLAKQQQPIEKK